MVGTIVPVVHGERASGHRPLVHWVHLLGSVTAAACVGLALGFVGASAVAGPSLASSLVAVVAALYLARVLGLVNVPAPQRHQQVPAAWRSRFGPYTMSLAYGVVLGSGIFTHIWALATYPILAWIALSAGPVGGLIAWSAFGLGRALPVVLIGSRTHDIDATFRIARRLEVWSQVVRIVDGMLLALIGGLFAGLLLHT